MIFESIYLKKLGTKAKDYINAIEALYDTTDNIDKFLKECSKKSLDPKEEILKHYSRRKEFIEKDEENKINTIMSTLVKFMEEKHEEDTKKIFRNYDIISYMKVLDSEKFQNYVDAMKEHKEYINEQKKQFKTNYTYNPETTELSNYDTEIMDLLKTYKKLNRIVSKKIEEKSKIIRKESHDLKASLATYCFSILKPEEVISRNIKEIIKEKELLETAYKKFEKSKVSAITKFELTHIEKTLENELKKTEINNNVIDSIKTLDNALEKYYHNVIDSKELIPYFLVDLIMPPSKAGIE